MPTVMSVLTDTVAGTIEPVTMFTYAEAAEKLDVKVSWLRWHRHRGNLLPDAVVGQTPLFAWKTLTEFVAGVRPAHRPRKRRVAVA